MNITRLNFAKTLPFIRSTLRTSHYLAFDLQMSGIMTEQLTTPSLIDSIQKRYEKQKQSIHKFIPLQFGLSAFTVQSTQRKIVAHPFNFYIFPLTEQQQIMKFSFHAGTMNFLTKNNFDFNKLFYQGIPYTNQQKLKQLQKNKKLDQVKRQLRRLKHIQSPQCRAFQKIHLGTVEQWLQSDSQILQINIQFVKYQAYILFQQKIQDMHQQQPLIFSYDNQEVFRRKKLIINKCTNQQKNASNGQINCQVQSQKLFSEVVNQIVSLKKPLITHNGYLDLMHVYYRFFQDLPDSWVTYKKRVHELFPYIYDNKYLFNSSPTLYHHAGTKYTGLSQCFTAMKEMSKKEWENYEEDKSQKIPIKFQISKDCPDYNLDNLECHEAGFDALMTGFSFLKGVTLLNDDLALLTNVQNFATQQKLIVNRTPQGSIKVPFCFNGEDEDIYIKDGGDPFFFKSILNEVISQQKIIQHFTKQFGSINLLWITRDMTQFSIQFINKQLCIAFERYLQSNCKFGNLFSIHINNVQLIILSKEQHQKSMNNFIKIDTIQPEVQPSELPTGK